MKHDAEQVAALALRRTAAGRLRVLLVTSRGTGRWVMPKGWSMPAVKPWRAAQIEALQEAGAEGPVTKRAIGEYTYVKLLDDRRCLTCRVRVYPMAVRKLNRNWKERRERQRRWFSLGAAARAVDERDLAKLLRSLLKAPKRHAVIRDVLGAP